MEARIGGSVAGGFEQAPRGGGVIAILRHVAGILRVLGRVVLGRRDEDLEPPVRVVEPVRRRRARAPRATRHRVGQIAFVAALEDGRGVLLVATPNEEDRENDEDNKK